MQDSTIDPKTLDVPDSREEKKIHPISAFQYAGPLLLNPGKPLPVTSISRLFKTGSQTVVESLMPLIRAGLVRWEPPVWKARGKPTRRLYVPVEHYPEVREGVDTYTLFEVQSRRPVYHSSRRYDQPVRHKQLYDGFTVAGRDDFAYERFLGNRHSDY